jgi:hypothetical protein
VGKPVSLLKYDQHMNPKFRPKNEEDLAYEKKCN